MYVLFHVSVGCVCFVSCLCRLCIFCFMLVYAMYVLFYVCIGIGAMDWPEKGII